ncbi:DUF6020 family protein [Enterococcus mundtii]|uniref:Glycosyltransferase RgtA/B/C/D-like domain-containing protein n=1 Tax=Enterococcus mundtii TaxID=53346 RepID=A0A242KW19_ENTMU|nr:DUF6020 family protein [Enterococcus mundtii]OTP25434.1 hypothetical protein A5802_002587 [Enterococcus mundtii]
METKKIRLLPIFFLTLLLFLISFLTALGLGSLNPLLILVLVYLLWYTGKKLGNDLFSWRLDFTTGVCILFSLLFSLILATGSRIQFTHVSANYEETTLDPFSFVQLLIALATFCYFLIILRFMIKYLIQISSYLGGINVDLQPTWKFFLLFTIIMLLCWTPYALTLYPGVVLPDSLSSVSQALGDTALNNHHPILFTLIVKFFIDILPTTINHGVFLFSLFQSLITALALSYSLCWLMKKKIKLAPVMLSLGYFSLAPVFPIYVLNMQKDILFSVACLLFSLTFFDVITNKNKPTIAQQLSLIIFALLTTYLRNNGLYVVIGSLVLYGIYTINNKKYQPFIQVTLSYLFLVILVFQPLMSRYAIPSQSAEQLGIPLQQISRTVVLDEGKLSKKDQEFLNQILPIEDYKAYAPSLADPVKWHKNFNNEFLNAHKKEFLMLWARNLPSNLKIYIDAYILETFGFWAPGVKNSYGFLDTRVNENSYGIKQANLIERYTGSSGLQTMIDQRDFWGSGTLLWLFLLSLFLLLVKKNTYPIALLLPGGFVFLTIMIATPVAFSLRYVFILALGLPIYLLSPFLLENENKTTTI